MFEPISSGCVYKPLFASVTRLAERSQVRHRVALRVPEWVDVMHDQPTRCHSAARTTVTVAFTDCTPNLFPVLCVGCGLSASPEVRPRPSLLNALELGRASETTHAARCSRCYPELNSTDFARLKCAAVTPSASEVAGHRAVRPNGGRLLGSKTPSAVLTGRIATLVAPLSAVADWLEYLAAALAWFRPIGHTSFYLEMAARRLSQQSLFALESAGGGG